MIVGGVFVDTVDFDPGPGVNERTADGGGRSDGFLLKLDNDGEFQWVRTYSGSGLDIPSAIGVNQSNDYYVTGIFSDGVDFDSEGAGQVRTPHGRFDAFLMKLDDGGGFQWVRTAGGGDTTSFADLRVGHSGEIYVSGSFYATTQSTQFDELEGRGPIAGGVDDTTIFARYDSDGGLDWVRHLDEVGVDFAYTVTPDANGDVLVGGILSYNSDNHAFYTRLAQPQLLVSNTNDSGPGSLRQAILDANANLGMDYIEFNIPGTGPHTISPDSPLPSILDPVMIDATSEPEFAGSPMVVLNGTNAGAGGLVLTADDSVIQGLVIHNFNGAGIAVTGSRNVIRGNYIGTTAAGDAAAGNTGAGVHIHSGASENRIGGSNARRSKRHFG